MHSTLAELRRDYGAYLGALSRHLWVRDVRSQKRLLFLPKVLESSFSKTNWQDWYDLRICGVISFSTSSFGWRRRDVVALVVREALNPPLLRLAIFKYLSR